MITVNPFNDELHYQKSLTSYKCSVWWSPVSCNSLRHHVRSQGVLGNVEKENQYLPMNLNSLGYSAGGGIGILVCGEVKAYDYTPLHIFSAIEMKFLKPTVDFLRYVFD
ncbi:hypothetical protein TNCV_3318271 [Trichonephila clavipes]|nr:hypothetical protein TNCV_3318271 [Trichonephila clavipes]